MVNEPREGEDWDDRRPGKKPRLELEGGNGGGASSDYYREGGRSPGEEGSARELERGGADRRHEGVRGLSPPPARGARGLSPPLARGVRDLSPHSSRGARGLSPPPARSVRGLSPPPARGVRGLSPPPTRGVRGLSPPPDRGVRGLSPPSTRGARGLSPPPTRGVRGLSPPSARGVRGLSPPSARGVRGLSPPSTRGVRGLSPPSTRGVRGLSPPSARGVRGLSPPPGRVIRGSTPPVAPPVPPPPVRGDLPKGARLLLANLSYTTTEDEITDFFRDAGAEVDKVQLVKVTPGNRVNGNAYVWLADERSVDIALDCDGREFAGRTLRVSKMPDDQRTACVRGLRPRSTPQDVEDLFEGCRIVGVRCRPVKGGHPDMSTWFVDFADEESFSKALAKDRTAPGLMICIATAQGRGGRSRREDTRGDYDRGGDYEGSRKRDRDGLDRDRDREDRDPRDIFDKKPVPDIGDGRSGMKGRNGVGNGGPVPRGRSRSRSRTPPARRYDRDRRYGDSRLRDRYGESDRMGFDRRDYDRDRYGGRRDERDHRGSPPRDDRYRSGRYDDRGRDRDTDRYRRDHDGGWVDRDRDRDYRRDRDYDRGRDYDRDRRMRDRGGRSDREHRDSRHEEPREKKPGKPLDTAVTTVLTNLPFCENRDTVVQTLWHTLEELSGDLKISEIVPVGRRCGAAIVVFKDEDSHGRAVALQSITINARKVNILPLEVPSVARVQKLSPGYSVEHILDDMQQRYDVDSLFVKLKQSDQLLLGIDDSRFLVRLLDIDGRPLLSSRYATVSYIPSRNYSESMAGRSRRGPDEYDDPNGRGGGSHRDKDGRDDRDNFGGKDRGRDGDMERRDSRGEGDDPRRSGDSRSHQRKDKEWVLRLSGLPKMMGERDVLDRFEKAGIKGMSLDKIGVNSALLLGGSTDHSVMEKVLNLCNDMTEGAALNGIVSAALIVRDKKTRALSNLGGGEPEAIKHSPKKIKREREEDWKGKDTSTPLSLTPSRTFRISPMTPSPGDYTAVLPTMTKKRPIDPNLTVTCKRLDGLRSLIMEHVAKEDADSYGEFCGTLHDLREPQSLIYTLSNDIDPVPPLVWSGNVQKGSTSLNAHCNGFLVLNSRQEEGDVRKAISEMPTSVKIEHRGKWDNDSFAHLLKPESVVVILKAADEGGKVARRVDTNGKIVAKSSEILNGILQSLIGKQRMGISRYLMAGKSKKYVALCIPPNRYIFEKMRVPWRFRDYAGHDSLLMVVGPKNPET